MGAAITFVAGVLDGAVFLAAQPDCAEAAAIHRWDRRVTTPAMLLTWALGVTLALTGGWFHDGWLLAKLAFVVALSAVHGMQSAKLRRLAGGLSTAAPLRLVAPFIVGSVVAIAILVIVKPL